jgi:protein gp37
MGMDKESIRMAENSKIEWTHHTFNPWIGCTKVSPGCANCYAETLMDTRYGRVQWGKGKPRSRTAADNWRKPKQWNKAATGERQRVFCASLADWMDDEVPIEWLQDLLAVIDDCKNLDWLLLTKRPENIYPRMMAAMNGNFDRLRTFAEHMPHVWLGTSAEDQQRWDSRLLSLTPIKASVHFVSAEPLLGPIDMGAFTPDWLIVGGESGPGARPMESAWVEALRDQANERGTGYHFKQWGGVDKKSTGRILDGRTWDELPSRQNALTPLVGENFNNK